MIKDNGVARFATDRAHRAAAEERRSRAGAPPRWQQVDLLPSLVRQSLAVKGHVTLDLGYGPITLPVELEPVAF